MYAIIEDSGRQFRVQEEDTIEIDTRPLDDGNDQIVFDKVLVIGEEDQEGSTRVGQPWVEGAAVTARVLAEHKDKKISVVKYKRRKGYRRTQGHRQELMRVQISKIQA